ncbi:MAG: HEAT repeat domain-containing protein [Nitrospirae bacterium]|nr:HEAT repeat domain-containing protein [Nitrospirota bacterium]
MNKWKGIFPVIVVCSLLLFSACHEVKKSTGEKELQEQKGAVMQPAPPASEAAPLNSEQITEDKPLSFEGCLDPGMLSQESAVGYLRILALGDHESISYYSESGQSEKRMYKGSGEAWYQNDICAAIKALSRRNNPEAYDLILQIIERKTRYPKAMVCAIRAIMVYGEFKDGFWHGDKRSIPVLKKAVNEKDPDIRLQAAGALLSLGEGDIALPVIDELAKAGAQQSIPAIYKLFTPEEKEDEGVKRIVRSGSRLFDERGKDILVRALNYSSDEVKVFAALRLTLMGIEQKRAEDTAIKILRQQTGKTIKEYQNIEEQQSERNAINYAIEVLEKIASTDGVRELKAFSESSSDSFFKARIQTTLKNISQKNNSLHKYD